MKYMLACSLIMYMFGVVASEMPQSKMNLGCYAIKNQRKKNCEDCLFAQTFNETTGCVAGVFDGHGGDGVAHFLKKEMPHALRELYGEDKIDASSFVHLFTTLEKEVSTLAIKGKFLQFSADYSAGSTAVVVVICKGTITVAWVGDSRAVIACKDGSVSATLDHIAGSVYAYNLLRQRKKDSEYINFSLKTPVFQTDFRIYHDTIMQGKSGQKKPHNFETYEDILAFFAGLNIKAFSSIRLNRCLIPCKTFGDISPFTKKKASFSAEPDIMQFPRDQVDFIIVATDGLWEKVTSEQAVALVKKEFELGKTVQQIAKMVSEMASSLGSTDDISVLIIKL